jgi:hypothetical protein
MSPERRLEVDAHNGAAEGWAADLREAGGGEDADVADVQLAPGDVLAVLGDHRVALQGTGSALACEVYGSARKRIADAAATEPCAGDKARHGPDAGVGSVLLSLAPGHAAEIRIGGARLHVAPAGGLTVDIGDKAARRDRSWMTAIGLFGSVCARSRSSPGQAFCPSLKRWQ